MQNPELRDQFDAKVTEFEKYQGFVAKAQALADQYSARVVETVVTDHQQRSMDVAGELMMIVGDVDSWMSELQGQRTATVEGAAAKRLALEELDLNLMIEAIDQAAYDAEAGPLQAAVGEADETTAGIDSELEAFTSVSGRWREAGTKAGVLS
jgi:hypothetical protein